MSEKQAEKKDKKFSMPCRKRQKKLKNVQNPIRGNISHRMIRMTCI